jgi:hypothetical protein
VGHKLLIHFNKILINTRPIAPRASPEDDPKDARSEPVSFVVGFASVYEFIGVSACKRLPIVGSAFVRFMHPWEAMRMRKTRALV